MGQGGGYGVRGALTACAAFGIAIAGCVRSDLPDERPGAAAQRASQGAQSVKERMRQGWSQDEVASSDRVTWSRSQVRQAQLILKRMGLYPGTVDGVFGGRMRSALTRFQEREDLAVTGDLSPETWAALSEGSDGRRAARERAGAGR